MAELFKVEYKCLGCGPDYPKPTAENALDLSIAKWQFIVDYYTEGQGVVDDNAGFTCALCKVLHCGDCPVAKRRGVGECLATPYQDYHWAVMGDDPVAALDAAKRELAFLQSLKEG